MIVVTVAQAEPAGHAGLVVMLVLGQYVPDGHAPHSEPCVGLNRPAGHAAQLPALVDRAGEE